MKYIGATDAFVNAPFFVEGIVINCQKYVSLQTG